MAPFKISSSLVALILLILLLVGFTFFLFNNQELKVLAGYIFEDVFLESSDQDLMLGSSSILRLKPREHLRCGFWLNRGIGNSTISSLKRYIYISSLFHTPTKILIYAGENDISKGSSVARTIREYEELLLYILKKYPVAELHVIAIKPSPARRDFWDKFQRVNEALEKYLGQIQRAYFHSPNWNAQTEKELASFTNDGVHLTYHGYTLFTSEINKLCRNH